jgi:hypothetical protein
MIMTGLAMAGCVPGDGGGGFCRNDLDCGSEDVCDNFGQCAWPGSVRLVSIRWTVWGQPPDEASCAPIDELRVTFEDWDSGNSTTFAPVLCTQGLITFTRVPLGFDGVNITAHDLMARVIDNARLPLQRSETRLEIDLTP